MKKLLVFLLASCLAFCSCGKNEAAPSAKAPAAQTSEQSPASKAPAAQAPVKENFAEIADALKLLEGVNLNNSADFAKIFKENGKISPLEFEALLVARSRCEKIPDSSMFKDCRAVDDAADIRGYLEKREISLDDKLSVLRKLVELPDSVIHAAVYEAFASIFMDGLKNNDIPKEQLDKLFAEYLELLKNEKDFYALKIAMHEYGFHEGGIRDFRNFNLEMMKHESPEVRREAVYNVTFAYRFGKPLFDDDAEKVTYHNAVLASLEDSDTQTSGYACQMLPFFDDASDIAVIKKVLASVDTKKMHNSCIMGLNRIVDGSETNAVAAYNAMIEYFNTINAELPYFTAFMFVPDKAALERYSAKHPEIKASDLITAFQAVIKNTDAAIGSRGGAFDAIVKVGGNYKDLEAVKDVLKGPDGDKLQENYKKALEKLIK